MWVEDARWVFPPAVQVHSGHVAAEVAVYHSIYIDHGYDFHNTVLEDVLGFWGFLQESTHQTFNHVRRPDFSRMLSGHHHYHLLFLLFLLAVLASYSHFRHLVTADGRSNTSHTPSQVWVS